MTGVEIIDDIHATDQRRSDSPHTSSGEGIGRGGSKEDRTKVDGKQVKLYLERVQRQVLL